MFKHEGLEEMPLATWKKQTVSQKMLQKCHFPPSILLSGFMRLDSLPQIHWAFCMLFRPSLPWISLLNLVSSGYSLGTSKRNWVNAISVHSKQDQPPVLVLIKGVINAKPFLKTLSPLIIYDNNGNYTQEINMIYGKDVHYEKW